MPTEANTCRKFVVPKLQAASWDTDPHSIAKQCGFTDGRMEIAADGKQLRVLTLADYTAEKVRTLCTSPEKLHACWVDAGQCADRFRKQEAAFFKFFAPEVREILNDLLEKYAAGGELQFTPPDPLKVRPISHHGNIAEIAQRFVGFEKLGDAVNKLQSLLYAA